MRLLQVAKRCFHTCIVRGKAGHHRVTPRGDYPLTYEQAQLPYRIGVTKSWNVWNSCSLDDPMRQPMDTVLEDMFVRKFVLGTWYKIWLSEVVIKRRNNDLVICGVICPVPTNTMVYFLTGFTEEILSQMLKLNVKVQVQAVTSRKAVVHKYI